MDELHRMSPVLTFLLVIMGLAARSSIAQQVTYYYVDQQGTVLATADQEGNILTTVERKPYGGQVIGTPTSGPGYTGHIEDSDTGLTYMQARYYDPVIGRFLSTDTQRPTPANLLDFNRYLYGNGNPYTYVDVDGRVAIVTQMKDRSIRVQFPTAFSGDKVAASSQNVASAKAQVAAMSGTYVVNGEERQVKFEVTPISTKLFGGTPRAARNEVKLVNGPTSSADGRSVADVSGKKAEIDVTDRFVENGVVPHEFLHLGGVDDLYNEATGKPDPTKGDSIMNVVPGRVDSSSVETLINSNKNIQREEK